MITIGDRFREIPQSASNDIDPYWNNGYFSNLDALALCSLIVKRKPKRYFEIGSGNSTKFASWTIEKFGLPTEIHAMDPNPRCSVEKICDRLVKKPLEDSDVTVFKELEPGDMLFFDGSHRLLMNSDVLVFFLEVLPQVNPGVLIHVHDIMIPYDYPPKWKERNFSELYVLALYLLQSQSSTKVIFPAYYVTMEPIFETELKRLSQIASLNSTLEGVSFWFEKSHNHL